MNDVPNTNSEPPLVQQVALPNANSEPPLVQRVELPPTQTPITRKPRPGLGEAIIWCVIFLCTQIFAALVTVLVVLGVFALQAPNASQFLNDQLAGLGAATVKIPPPDGTPRPAMPTEIGQSFAYGMLAAQIASLGLILLVVPRRIGPDWKRQIGVRRPAGLHVLLVLLLVPGFMLLGDGVQVLVKKATGLQPSAANQALNSMFNSFPWFLTFLAVALGPGLAEEVWCRGFLGRGLSSRYGLVVGVILTSALFGIMHVDPAHAMVAAVMGVYLHFVYLASRSIWLSILLHALNNGIAVLAMLTGAGIELEADPRGLTKVIYLASFSLVLFASVALWTSRAKVISVRGNEDDWQDAPGWKPEYPGISTPPAEALVNVRLSYASVSPVAVMLTLVSFLVLGYLLSR